MSKHTKTPYMVDEPMTVLIDDHAHNIWPIATTSRPVRDEFDGTAIAIVILPEEDDSIKARKERAATAAFLVKAANAYEQMMEALERLASGESFTVAFAIKDTAEGCELKARIAYARAALALTGEEATRNV